MIFVQLFLTFFKIGLFTVGGGYAMLPFIQEEVVLKGWLTNEQILNFIAVSESTPGPFAINTSTYVGMEMGSRGLGILGGFLGAFCATLGVVLPSFIIILIVARCYEKFQDSSIVNGCMSGLKPAVIGLISVAVLSTGKTVFFPNGFDFSSLITVNFISGLIIFAIAFLLIMKKKHPISVIGISAIFGILVGYIQKLM